MIVEVITMWYNEEFLAPFFLNNYAWADKITVLLDQDTTDATPTILAAHPKTNVVPFRFPDMMDDSIKTDRLIQAYRESQADWVLVVDADEFAFYKDGETFRYDLRPVIMRSPGSEVFIVTLYQIYRHESDSDLDPALPPVPQRRHGDPNVTEGVNRRYNKPVLVKTGLNIGWSAGCHELLLKEGEGVRLSREKLLGAHWAMADPEFAVTRRVRDRRERQSQHNLRTGMTSHHHHVTVKKVMEEVMQHWHDPQVF